MPKSIRKWFWNAYAVPFPNFYAKHGLPNRWGQFATNQDTKRKAKPETKGESRSPQTLME